MNGFANVMQWHDWWWLMLGRVRFQSHRHTLVLCCRKTSLH